MKVYFCGMSGPNSLENLKELLLPIYNYFDGLVWILHDSKNSEEEKFLESIKKEGKVIHYYYHKRHNESRNQYLWCGPIKQGDWICQTDDLERLVPNFAVNIRNCIAECEKRDLNAIFYYNKPLLFKYHESIRFDGNPHEGLNRQDKNLKAFDFSCSEPDESKVRINVRNQKRDEKTHWVKHLANYMLFPWGSNHSLLGWEKRSPLEIQERDRYRLNFIDLMRERGYSIDVDGLHKMLSGPIDDIIKAYLNYEQIWNNYYRFYILNHKIDDIIKDNDNKVLFKI